MMAELGRIAAVGDTVPVSGGTLEVERMDGRRIDRVRFLPGPSGDEAGRTGATALPEGGPR